MPGDKAKPSNDDGSHATLLLLPRRPLREGESAAPLVAVHPILLQPRRRLSIRQMAVTWGFRLSAFHQSIPAAVTTGRSSTNRGDSSVNVDVTCAFRMSASISIDRFRRCGKSGSST